MCLVQLLFLPITIAMVVVSVETKAAMDLVAIAAGMACAAIELPFRVLGALFGGAGGMMTNQCIKETNGRPFKLRQCAYELH